MHTIIPGKTRATLSRSVHSLLGVALVLSALSGCSVLPQAAEDPTRYYVLSSPPPLQAESPSASTVLFLRTIELPAYLRNSKSIVVRRGDHELRYEDFSRWAEPLEAGIHRVLRERLAGAGNVRAVLSPPHGGREAPDFDVRVRILRCEGQAGPEGGVLFSASYEILRSSNGERLVRSTFHLPDTAWQGGDYAGLAARISEAVERLADAIAAQVPSKDASL